MRLVHCADQHLGAAASRLDAETGLNSALMDRYRCARFVVTDALERGAQCILSAGDLFNSAKPTPTEVHLAREVFAPAQAAGVPTILLLGNHELARSENEKPALDLLRDTPGITIVDRPCLLNVWTHDGLPAQVRSAETTNGPLVSSGLALQVACLPYCNSSLLLRDEEARKLEPGERNLRVRELMMDVARGLAAQRIEGVPCVLLGHFSVDVAIAGAQDRLMMLGGEWTLNLQDLESLGFDAVLLGHIHKGQQLGIITSYSGSPEACSFSEEGEEKSYLLFSEVRPGIFEREAVPTPYRRLVTLDAPSHSSIEAMSARGELRGVIVRLRLPQAAAHQVRELVSQLEDLGAHEVRVEVERAETQRRREIEVSAGMDLPTALRLWLGQKPDLAALTEDLVAEAASVAAEGGAS